MVLFNYATKEITAKIVYYGPGLCGKTTNLQFVYDSLPSNNKSKMLSLATKTDRTLFFDFLPLDLGKIRGMRTKLQLYTVPGQVYYNSTRQLVLKGADGVVFVADSQDFALDANLESLQNLEDNLKRQGIRLREMPLVLQYNKRDLPNAMSVEELNQEVNKQGVPSFQSVATTGLGVEETLKGITQLVLTHLVKKYGLEGSEPLDINILNAPANAPAADDSLWDEDDEEPFGTPAVAPAPAARWGGDLQPGGESRRPVAGGHQQEGQIGLGVRRRDRAGARPRADHPASAERSRDLTGQQVRIRHAGGGRVGAGIGGRDRPARDGAGRIGRRRAAGGRDRLLADRGRALAQGAIRG
jgi:hypothetical protein